MRSHAAWILIGGSVLALVLGLAFFSSGSESRAGLTTATPPVEPVTDAVPRDAGPAAAPSSRPPRPETVPSTPSRNLTASGEWENALIGHVLDTDGSPVPEAWVSLVADSETNRTAQLIGRVEGLQDPRALARRKSDEEGDVRFEGIEPGDDYALLVDHEDFARSQRGPITIPAAGTVEEFVELTHASTLHGRVLDGRTGEPLAGARVMIDDPTLAHLPDEQNPRRQARSSGLDGAYSFEDIEPGLRLLRCSKEGYATVEIGYLGFGAGQPASQEYDLELEPGTSIAGSVLDPRDAGIAGVTVEAFTSLDGRTCRSSGQTDEEGRFVVEGLLEGRYAIQVSAQGWEGDPLVGIASGATDVVLHMEPLGSVSGRVIAAATRKPVTAFQVVVREALDPAAPCSECGETHTIPGVQVVEQSFAGREDGSFEVVGVPAGGFVVQARAGGFADAFSTSFTVEERGSATDVEVALGAGGTLAGRVVDAATKEPMAGVVVETHESNWVDSEYTAVIGFGSVPALSERKVATDAEGRFVLEGMIAGEYQLRVRHADFVPIVRNGIPVHDGRVTEIEDAALGKGGVITGTVFAEDGSAVARAEVFLEPTDVDLIHRKQIRTDEQGRYRLLNCAPGKYKLSAARPYDHFVESVPQDTAHSETEITVTAGREHSQDLFLGDS